MTIVHILSLAAAVCGAVGKQPSAKDGHCKLGGECIAFESSSADTLMQMKEKVTKTSSNLGEQRDAQTSADPPGTVRFNKDITFEVKREEFHGFPMEVFYKIPKAAFGDIDKTNKKVFVPFGQMMKAEFVRDFHAVGVHEYGMASWVWTPNLMSVMTDKPAVGIGEKMHIFTHDGTWSEESRQKVEAEIAARASDPMGPKLNMYADILQHSRSTAVNAWMMLSQVGGQMGRASVDPAILFANRAFAADKDASKRAHVNAARAAMGEKLAREHAAFVQQVSGGALPPPHSTGANCHHLESSEGLEMEFDGKIPTGFWWPLDQLMPSMRGELNFEPLKRIGFGTGNTILKFNDQDDTFELYWSAVMASNIVDPTLNVEKYPPTLFVGPVDGGEHSPILPEHRQPVAATQGSDLVDAMWNAFNQPFPAGVPADYNFLFQDPDEICPPDKAENVKSAMRANFLNFMQLADVRSPSTPAQKKLAIAEITSWLPCAAEYCRADRPHSHSYGPFEAMGFMHALVEGGTLVFTRGWNDMEVFCAEVGCTMPTPTPTKVSTPSEWEDLRPE